MKINYCVNIFCEVINYIVFIKLLKLHVVDAFFKNSTLLFTSITKSVLDILPNNQPLLNYLSLTSSLKKNR